MKITLSPDEKRILFSKHFTKEDHLTAECLGMKSRKSNEIVADIRVTCKEALIGFVTAMDKNLMRSPYNTVKKKQFIDTIKRIYKQDAIEFIQQYKPMDLYSDIDRKPHKHQAEGLWMFRNRQYNLCAFEQGLGKTMFAASISKIFNLKRTVIICPALTKWNWYEDLTQEWGFNALFFTLLDREKTMFSIMKETFVIVNYESIKKYYEHIVKDDVDHIIIDEAHYVKNKTTDKYKNVERLIKKFPTARVTFLTGTPIKNRITDVFALLRLSNHPMGRAFHDFRQRYAKGRGQKITGVKNVDDFRLKLSNWMLRKKSAEELDLPGLTIERRYFDMDNASTKKYNDEIASMHKAQKKANEVQLQIDDLKNAIGRGEDVERNKRKLGWARRDLKKYNMKAKGNIMTLNRICSESKIPDVIKLINKMNAEGEKVIVFSFFKKVLNVLYNELGNKAVLIDGSVSSIKRRDKIDKFKKKEDITVFLGQTIAAGIGINLVNARKVIFLDLAFTPDLLEQPYKRAHRMGQKRDVEVIYTMIPKSIDGRIYRLIQGKTDDINSTIDHGKEGNVEYGNLEKKLFNELMRDYESENNIKNSVINKFQKV